jgi:hypothetical protein
MPRTRAEIGALGLPLFNGYLSMDTNAKLRGRAGAKIYREMMLDEPCAGAFVAACNTLLRTDLQVTTGGSTDADKRAGEFLEQCLDDMRDSKDTLLRRSFSSVPYGWSIMELVYKRRAGGTGSRYTDGKVGWATWALRRQETRSGTATGRAGSPALSSARRRRSTSASSRCTSACMWSLMTLRAAPRGAARCAACTSQLTSSRIWSCCGGSAWSASAPACRCSSATIAWS